MMKETAEHRARGCRIKRRKRKRRGKREDER